MKRLDVSNSGRFEQLKNGLSAVRESAHNHGVALHYEVHADEEVFNHEHDVAMFSASTGKLALAATIALYRPKHANHPITIYSSDVATEGGGLLDFPQANNKHREYPLEVPLKYVMKDMLGRSSNTAFRVLARYNAETIQKQYAQLGWHNTTLLEREGGWVEIGTSSPEEVLDQLQLISTLSESEGNPTARSAVKGLRMVTDTTHGLGLYDLSEVEILRKTGKYNGDPTDPHVYRHEVARVIGNQKSIDYAFMTQSQGYSKKQRITTNHVLNLASGEIATYLGLRRKRFVGLRALLS